MRYVTLYHTTLFGMRLLYTNTHGGFSLFFNISDKILVFQTLRLSQIRILSVNHDLLLFYPSDLDKIWYVTAIRMDIFGVFFIFQFFRQNTRFRTLRLRQIAHLPTLSVR